MEFRRRYVISAGIVAFIAWGHATYWAPSLTYLPWAFIAGVLATVGLALYITATTSRSPSQLKDSITEGSKKDEVKTHAAFITPGRWEAEKAALWRRSRYTRAPLYPSSILISDAADELLDLVERDFIRSWYGKISLRSTFPNEVDRAVRGALGAIRDRVLAVDLVEVVVSRILPIITAHLKDFQDAERKVRGRKLARNFTESEELDLAIAGKFRDGKLHHAASLGHSNLKVIQQQHLRGLVTRLLPKVLPKDMMKSASVNVLVREIVACAVLFPLMKILADPDTWNQILEAYGRTALQDRKTVKKLRAALDEHAPASPKAQKNVVFPKLRPGDHERHFEKFIRAIRQCNSLSDARRFRSEVASQLRKESAVENQDQAYLKRLSTGKRILDQRVAVLGAGGTLKGKPEAPPASTQVEPPTSTGRNLENSSLREILYDATGLSYFMEYMDRTRLMRLVQFWIVVDGMRDPLEEDTDEPDDSITLAKSWTSSDRMDLAQIYEAYLSKPELQVAGEYRETVRAFLKAGSDATPSQYHAARRAVLRSQTAVYEDMRKMHFPNFKKSDLFFKWLAANDTKVTAKKPPAIATNGLQVHVDSVSPTNTSRPKLAKHLSTSTNLTSKPVEAPRSVASSSDIRRDLKTSDLMAPTRRSADLPRRSVDDSAGRAPLFDDDLDNDPLAQSTQSLDSAPDPSQKRQDDEQIVDAMQAALNNIMEDGDKNQDTERGSLFSDVSVKTPTDSARGSLDISRPDSPAFRKEKEKPSIASLGLVGAPTRGLVFNDDDLFGNEENFPEDEREDENKTGGNIEDEIHEAAPGDLGLSEAIDGLTVEIERLVSQDSIVDSLTKKAELTNNAAELRILRKSKASLQREIHRKELQRQQYIVQESDNSLYGRATVNVKSIMVATEEDGHEFAVYVIEVQRRAGDQMPAATWVVARRYSEFHELNKKLRANYPIIRHLEFPRRHAVLSMQKDVLQKRKVALERWLRELLLIPAICRSRELRAFLSQQALPSTGGPTEQAQQRDFVARIYNSVTDGMEEFLGNIPVLDQLSLAGQNLISAATSQLAAAGTTNSNAVSSLPELSSASTTSAVSNSINPDALSLASSTASIPSALPLDASAEAELSSLEAGAPSTFIKPIADIFLELFSLNTDGNWLRGRAVVVVLHQLLGGTIERKVRDQVRNLTNEESIAKYLTMVKDMMWPGGVLKKMEDRSVAQREASRKEAGLILATLLPDLAGSVVGGRNAISAARRVAAVENNERLNVHLTFTILDEIVGVIFGETVVKA